MVVEVGRVGRLLVVEVVDDVDAPASPKRVDEEAVGKPFDVGNGRPRVEDVDVGNRRPLVVEGVEVAIGRPRVENFDVDIGRPLVVAGVEVVNGSPGVEDVKDKGTVGDGRPVSEDVKVETPVTAGKEVVEWPLEE